VTNIVPFVRAYEICLTGIKGKNQLHRIYLSREFLVWMMSSAELFMEEVNEAITYGFFLFKQQT
jgi:hypothetical protein